MRLFDQKQISNYKRNLGKESVHTSLYTILLFSAVFIYGIFGLIPFFSVLKEKADTIRDLSKINQDLEMKIGDLESIEEELDKSKIYIDALHMAVPQTKDIQSYMVDLNSVVAKVGYKQRKLYVSSILNGEVELSVSFEGNPNSLYDLISTVENMRRLTTIETFSFRYQEDLAKVLILVKIFYFGK